MICVELPWPHKDLSPNARPHRMAKARATKKARADAKAVASSQARRVVIEPKPVRVRVTFSPPGRHGYDDDNLMASVKAYRDGIADALGINDNLFRMAPPVIGEVVKGGNVRFEIEPIDDQVQGG